MDIDKDHSFIFFLYNSVNQSHIYTLPSPAVAKYSPIKRNKTWNSKQIGVKESQKTVHKDSIYYMY